jgi:hypothetical protein
MATIVVSACGDPPCTDTLTCEPASGGASADGGGGSTQDGGGGGGGGTGGNGGADCGDMQTDPLNCGTCGHDCLGGACTVGECQPVVLYTGVSGGAYVAVDATSVYLFDGGQSNAVVGRIPINGGTFEVLDTGLQGPIAIASNGAQLFYSGRVAEGAGFGRVWRTDLVSTNSAVAITNLDIPWELALDATHVYFADRNRGGIWRASLGATNNDGGEPSLIGLTDPASLALSGTTLYVADAGTGEIVRGQATNGGVGTTVVSGLVNPLKVDANASWFCWIDDYAALQCRATDGGSIINVGADATDLHIALDGDWVYWAHGTGQSSVVDAILITDPAVSVRLAEMLDSFGGLAYDSQAIYWAAGQSVSKLAKPVEITGN